MRSGGSALNTATALQRFGLDVAIAGKVGRDALGDFLLALCDERGLDRGAVAQDPDAPTAATIVLVDHDGEQTFLHVPGANGALRADDLDHERIFSGRALHVGGALVLPALDGGPMASLLAEARSRGLLTSLDPAFDATGRWGRIEPCLPRVDLFSADLVEARAVTGEEEPPSIARRLRARGAGGVAVKLGPDGCYAAGESFEGYVEAVPVRAVDGTGAGDAFAAALLFGRLNGWPLERAARLANAAGALATTAVGATEGVRGMDETLAAARLQA